MKGRESERESKEEGAGEEEESFDLGQTWALQIFSGCPIRIDLQVD